jgi:hypothetical protein
MEEVKDGSKAFLTIRLDGSLKWELAQASQVERRSLSNFSRLLLEYAWGQYLKAGSVKDMLTRKEHSQVKED